MSSSSSSQITDLKLPDRIKKLDNLLNRSFKVQENDEETAAATINYQVALVTALQLIKYCNKAAIDTLFPPNSSVMSSPWEVACHASVTFSRQQTNYSSSSSPPHAIQTNRTLTIFPIFIRPRSLNRAAQLLSLAQQYLTDVVSKIMTPQLIPSASPNCERLATAWPFIVTLSHQGIVSFYGGRQRLALGYIEAAISMVKNCLGIYDKAPTTMTSNNNKKNKSDNSPNPNKGISSASPKRNNTSPASNSRSPSPSPPPPLIHSDSDGSDSSLNSLSNLRHAAVTLTKLMNGNKDCSIQLIVLLLNYSRILVSLKKYNHARDSAALAKQMLEDLQDVEMARASEALAEVAVNESQDWPSLLNGRTNLPLLQSFCSYTLGDVDVLSKPTNVKVLENSLLLFRDADLSAAAADVPTRDCVNGGYRQMIFEKARMVAEQLDLVNETLEKEKRDLKQTEAEVMASIHFINNNSKRQQQHNTNNDTSHHDQNVSNATLNSSSASFILSVNRELNSMPYYIPNGGGEFSPLPKNPNRNGDSATKNNGNVSHNHQDYSDILKRPSTASSSPTRRSSSSSNKTKKPTNVSSKKSTSSSKCSGGAAALSSSSALLKSALEHRMRRGTPIDQKKQHNNSSSILSSATTNYSSPMKGKSGGPSSNNKNIGLRAFNERNYNMLRRPSSSGAGGRNIFNHRTVHFIGSRSPSPFI